MRCVFCKTTSDSSKTVEHIVTESLGNTEHILPPGVVCDKCNNYFAREVEKPLLDSNYFRHARFRNSVANKRGKIPIIEGFHLQSLSPIGMIKNNEGVGIFSLHDKDEQHFINTIRNSRRGSAIFPSPLTPTEYIVSRFLGKMAIEALASRVMDIPGGLDEIIDKVELDELRDYVRLGSLKKSWPFYERRIYVEGKLFADSEDEEEYEILHEFTLLYTSSDELYFIIAIFGIEYTLNLGGPEISGYVQWLTQNNNQSPLYP